MQISLHNEAAIAGIGLTEFSKESGVSELSLAADCIVDACRDAGGKILAVGSTSLRTLETVAPQGFPVQPAEGRSDLYIFPPYTFGLVDRLLTNFHLPESTLIMLVCAFGGTELIMEAYHKAIEQKYRFYSYGDCMLVL